MIAARSLVPGLAGSQSFHGSAASQASKRKTRRTAEPSAARTAAGEGSAGCHEIESRFQPAATGTGAEGLGAPARDAPAGDTAAAAAEPLPAAIAKSGGDGGGGICNRGRSRAPRGSEEAAGSTDGALGAGARPDSVAGRSSFGSTARSAPSRTPTAAEVRATGRIAETSASPARAPARTRSRTATGSPPTISVRVTATPNASRAAAGIASSGPVGNDRTTSSPRAIARLAANPFVTDRLVIARLRAEALANLPGRTSRGSISHPDLQSRDPALSI